MSSATTSSAKPVRRSVVIPRGLAEEASALAPKELRKNFNRLVVTALGAFVREEKERRLREQLAAMARDEEIRADCAAIGAAFRVADGDGLSKLP